MTRSRSRQHIYDGNHRDRSIFRNIVFDSTLMGSTSPGYIMAGNPKGNNTTATSPSYRQLHMTCVYIPSLSHSKHGTASDVVIDGFAVKTSSNFVGSGNFTIGMGLWNVDEHGLPSSLVSWGKTNSQTLSASTVYTISPSTGNNVTTIKGNKWYWLGYKGGGSDSSNYNSSIALESTSRLLYGASWHRDEWFPSLDALELGSCVYWYAYPDLWESPSDFPYTSGWNTGFPFGDSLHAHSNQYRHRAHIGNDSMATDITQLYLSAVVINSQYRIRNL